MAEIETHCDYCGKLISRRAHANVIGDKVFCTPCRDEHERGMRRQQIAKEELQSRGEPKSFFSRIAGVTFPNPNGTSRQKIIRKCREGERLLLVRDPRNRYSPHAIMILRQNGAQLGWVPSHTSAELAGKMDEGASAQAEISKLTGGTRDAPTHGVNILITYIEEPPARKSVAIPTIVWTFKALGQLIGFVIRRMRRR